MSSIFNQNKKGFSITEILVVIAISGITLLGILGLATFSLRQIKDYETSASAVFLATDMLEGVRSIRDENWDNITFPTINMGANYHPVQAGVSPNWFWQLQPGIELVSNFYTRYVIFENVSRDANDNIEAVYNPVNDDPDTKKVKAIVSWPSGETTKQIEIITYLTNWR